MAENGIFIFLALVYFYCRMMRAMKRTAVVFWGYPFEYTMARGLYASLISIFIVSLYNLVATEMLMSMYFIWALAISLIYRCKRAGRSR